MRERRILLPPFSQGNLRIEGERHQHISRSLRMRVGHRLVLTDGEGREAAAEITGFDKQGTEVEVGAIKVADAPEPEIHVVQALGKGSKLDEVVRALAELGVRRFTPLLTERTVRQKDTQDRWQKIADEALCVSGRVWRMHVAAVQTWDAVLAQTDSIVMLHGDASEGLPEVIETLGDSVCLVIGPEGGFSEPEVEAAKEAKACFARLGGYTLRLQTAGPAAVATVQALRGNLG